MVVGGAGLRRSRHDRQARRRPYDNNITNDERRPIHIDIYIYRCGFVGGQGPLCTRRNRRNRSATPKRFFLLRPGANKSVVNVLQLCGVPGLFCQNIRACMYVRFCLYVGGVQAQMQSHW